MDEEIFVVEILAEEGEIDKCTEQSVVTAERNVRCLLNHPVTNLFTAAIVLKGTTEVRIQQDLEIGIPEDLILKTGIIDRLKITNNSIH
ncbi:hypothetical protein A3D78_00520 [Candidatus Gottesmanbacteria bacterium RIFCSPHIGHO2_02_FULL_39_14]|uniref:Uncharacterized protein n=1 Tax=Candidatus Gottesmanbacteria bacterium RIFCSPHIGHO2_02_FULL_39_14 TaxID=1798383 RepID=A0A1F5ZXJ5_9BACT|nr:MAG: hypothetical protein A3D78_00520 [Candidatus Gottesmanbacteria bacterium RIFCSPHIGHO2_02_FULL_39_14]